ncbi:MAG TPA: RNA polymerase sigma-70 factor [Bacteroidales bacterium]|nr:RNA polymerase sigma-70 factor [Bacteroidales bacterium]HPM87875.1 RNA polymerase sigma-70 factor [Bacteroidales bacterium]
MDQYSEDTELVKRLQKGDVEAFDLLYEKYSVRLYSFGLKYLRSASETEELVQSVFLKIWENHRQLKKELSFKSFLFTIAYNDICKLFRKRKYTQIFIDEAIHENNQSSSETVERIDYQSTLSRVVQIIDKLPQRQKDIIRKSRLEGKPSKEIAEEMKLSSGTVDNYISEALKYIRGHLRKEDLALVLFFSMYLL